MDCVDNSACSCPASLTVHMQLCTPDLSFVTAGRVFSRASHVSVINTNMETPESTHVQTWKPVLYVMHAQIPYPPCDTFMFVQGPAKVWDIHRGVCHSFQHSMCTQHPVGHAACRKWGAKRGGLLCPWGSQQYLQNGLALNDTTDTGHRSATPLYVQPTLATEYLLHNMTYKCLTTRLINKTDCRDSIVWN